LLLSENRNIKHSLSKVGSYFIAISTILIYDHGSCSTSTMKKFHLVQELILISTWSMDQ